MLDAKGEQKRKGYKHHSFLPPLQIQHVERSIADVNSYRHQQMDDQQGGTF